MRVSLRSVLAVVAALGAACSRAEPDPTPAPAASRETALVPAPASLVAELTVPDPRRLWSALRALGGSRVQTWPSSFELALFLTFGLPARVAGFVKPDTPVVGAVLAPSGAPPSLVLAVRTVRGAELVQELTRPDGGFRAERDGADLTLLIGEPSTNVLGVIDDWFVSAPDAASLRGAARYLARGLGARPLPDAPLAISASRAALTGPARESVEKSWAALREGLAASARETRAELGRAADFADPEAILRECDGRFGTLLEFLSSSERLTIRLIPKDDRLELGVSVVPEPNGALARYLDALEVGPVAPLFDAPSASELAVLFRSSEAERAEAADQPADALRSLLGSRLAEKDAAPLASALRSIHRGRGSSTLAGWAGTSAFVRQEANDPKELERGFRALVRMARIPALAEPLGALVGTPQSDARTVKVPGVEGSVVRVALQKEGRREMRELLATVRNGTALVVVDDPGGNTFSTLASGADRLDSKPWATALAEGRAAAAFALFSDVSRYAATSVRFTGRPTGRQSDAPAPVLAVFGKRGNEASLELILSAPACAALVALAGTP